MTIDELQSHVRRLSNSCHVRWWAHWNYPQQSPWLMAIHLMDYRHEIHCAEMLKAGFCGESSNGYTYLVAERTNEDGTPFRSQL